MSARPRTPAWSSSGTSPSTTSCCPTARTRWRTLGGNSVHAAARRAAWEPPSALVARRGEDFPPGALTRSPAPASTRRRGRDPRADRPQLGRLRGRRPPALALPDPAGALRRGGVRRRGRAAAWLADAPVVHVAAMPLAHAEAIVAARPGAPPAAPDHSRHPRGLGGRTSATGCSRWPRAVHAFVPSREELPDADRQRRPRSGHCGALAALPTAGVVVKAGADGCVCARRPDGACRAGVSRGRGRRLDRGRRRVLRWAGRRAGGRSERRSRRPRRAAPSSAAFAVERLRLRLRCGRSTGGSAERRRRAPAPPASTRRPRAGPAATGRRPTSARST